MIINATCDACGRMTSPPPEPEPEPEPVVLTGKAVRKEIRRRFYAWVKDIWLLALVIFQFLWVILGGAALILTWQGQDGGLSHRTNMVMLTVWLVVTVVVIVVLLALTVMFVYRDAREKAVKALTGASNGNS